MQISEFKTSLVFRERSSAARATQRHPVQKNQKKKSLGWWLKRCSPIFERLEEQDFKIILYYISTQLRASLGYMRP